MTEKQPELTWWFDAGEYLTILNFLYKQAANPLWARIAIGGICLSLLPQSMHTVIIIISSALIWLSQREKKQNPSPPPSSHNKSWFGTLQEQIQQRLDNWSHTPIYNFILGVTIVWGTTTSLYDFCGLVALATGLTGVLTQISLFFLSSCCMVAVQQHKIRHHNHKENPKQSALETFNHYSKQPYFTLTSTLTIIGLLSTVILSNLSISWLVIILTLTAVTEHQHRQAKKTLEQTFIKSSNPKRLKKIADKPKTITCKNKAGPSPRLTTATSCTKYRQQNKTLEPSCTKPDNLAKLPTTARKAKTSVRKNKAKRYLEQIPSTSRSHSYRKYRQHKITLQPSCTKPDNLAKLPTTARKAKTSVRKNKAKRYLQQIPSTSRSHSYRKYRQHKKTQKPLAKHQKFTIVLPFPLTKIDPNRDCIHTP